jgi:gliding motility-associated-like protein
MTKITQSTQMNFRKDYPVWILLLFFLLSHNALAQFDGTQRIISLTSLSPRGVFAADLDNDGDIDLAVASASDNKIAWYANDGTGNFSAERIVSTNAIFARFVYGGDLDGDGFVDLVSASLQDNKVAWYRNNGNGTFSPEIIVDGNASGAWSVFTADLDGDGDLDILASHNLSNTIVWYRNNGNGVFSAPISVSNNAQEVRTVISVDIDNDGDMDIVAALFRSNQVVLFRNDGDGIFTGPTVVTNQALGAQDVYAADLDNDGFIDILSASSTDNKIAWYKNNGGNLGPQNIIATTAVAARAVYTGDFTGNGLQDVVSASFNDNKIAWYRNNGNGSFEIENIVSTEARFAQGVITADLDGDGDIDIVSVSQGDNKVAWYENILCEANITRLYVRRNATGTGSGETWADALTELSAAIEIAKTCPNIREIWVAAGTYLPQNPNGGPSTSQLSFELRNNLGIYGGFNGTETNLSDRDFENNQTILSGDIGVPNNIGDNVFNVVRSVDHDETAILDGFYIRFGNANATGGERNRGGGMLVIGGSPTIRNCTFSQNRSLVSGGALAVVNNGFPTIRNVNFTGNQSENDGGAISVTDDSRINISFSNFSGNTAANGGAIFTENGILNIAGAQFISNVASQGGGGIFLINASASIANAVFFNNRATTSGGGLSIISSSTNLVNNTLVHNQAPSGSAIGAGISANSFLRNSIVWFNSGAQIVASGGAQLAVSFSNVQGGAPGAGNIDSEPVFFIAPNPGEGNPGDLRLQETSPGVDQGDNASLPQDITDLNENGNRTEPLPLDLGGINRVIDVVDMGAFEFTDNNPPVDITLDPGEIEENEPVGTLVGVLDAVDPDADETFTFQLVSGPGDADNRFFTISGNQLLSAAVFDFEERETYSVRIRVTDAVGNTFEKAFEIRIIDVDEQPSFDLIITEYIVREDSGPHAIEALAININDGDRNDGSQPLTFIIDNDNPALFSVLPTIDRNGNFSFVTAPDAFGTANLTIRLSDGNSLSEPRTLTVVLLPVNDRPSFTASDPAVIPVDAGPQTLPNWATFDPGAPNESDQTATYLVSDISDPSFFTTPPSISPDGTLTFEVGPGVAGVVTFVVRVQDNGGTANGGIDTSLPQTFRIRVGDQPSFIPGGDVEVNEDAGAVSVETWATDIRNFTGGEEPATFRIISNSNTALFATLPSIDLDGTLSFVTAPDEFGEAIIEVELSDGEISSGPETFAIRILPVNDPPVVSPIANLEADFVDTPQSVVVGTASPGPPNESNQLLTFNATSSNMGIVRNLSVAFDPATGRMTLTFTTISPGTATITLTVRDNGGTANGGMNVTVLSFEIEVLDNKVTPMYLPNLFSPNDDQVNDRFRILGGGGVDTFIFRIFDNKGTLLYETNDLNEARNTGWDGKHKGIPQPSGAYFWQVTGRFLNRQPITIEGKNTGSFTLIR